MKKKLLILVLVLVLIPTVAIAGTASEQIKVQKNVATITVNGQKITADNFVYDGTTYVPLRTVSENMGAKVDWDNATKTAKIVQSQATESNKYNDNDFKTQYLYYNLYKKSAETKDIVNAMAIHLLTSTGDMSTPNTIQPVAEKLFKDIVGQHDLYKAFGGDIYDSYLLVYSDVVKATAMVNVCVKNKTTSAQSDSKLALDTCQEILDDCDTNNQHIHSLVIENLAK